MKKIIFFSLLSVLFFQMSCSKKTSKDKIQHQVKLDTVYKLKSDALNLVSEVYDTYQSSEDFLVKGIFYPANLLSQDFKGWGASSSYQKYNVPVNFPAINKMWIASYQGIFKANLAIKHLKNMVKNQVISKELGDRLIAECLFNRSIFYTLLADNFGGVPIIGNQSSGTINKARNTQNEVFETVQKDLLTAANYLPWQYKTKGDIGRATKGAAYAYLGEAYMWLKDYNNAALAFTKLSNHYSLMSHFIDINSFKHQNNKESIFEIQFNGTDNLGWGRDNYSSFIQSFALPNEVGGTAYVYANPKLFNSYSKKDKRRRASIIAPGETHPDPNINISNYNNVQENFKGINTLGTRKHPWLGDAKDHSGYYGIKTWRAPDPNASASTIFNKANVILMRYGQVVLDNAEANYKMGNKKEGLKLLNIIRKRAGLKPTSSSNFITKLLNEYRHELSGGMTLWYVIRRTGEDVKYIKDNFNINIQKGHDILPIPQIQITNNPKLIQNLGY